MPRRRRQKAHHNLLLLAAVTVVFAAGLFAGIASSTHVAVPNPGHSWVQLGAIPQVLEDIAANLVYTDILTTVGASQNVPAAKNFPGLDADTLDDISSNGFLKTDVTGQSVAAGKPKVTDLDADKLDTLDSSQFCRGDQTSGTNCPVMTITLAAPGQSTSVAANTAFSVTSNCPAPATDWIPIFCTYTYDNPSGAVRGPKEFTMYPSTVGNQPIGCRFDGVTDTGPVTLISVQAHCMKLPFKAVI